MAQALTKAFNYHRHGANLQETRLTPAYIQAHGVRLLNTYAFDDDARGIEAAPLVVEDVVTDDGDPHEIVLFATMGNYLYAFDRDTYRLLWRKWLGRPVDGGKAIDSWEINDKWGQLGTGCIDPVRGIYYGCVLTSPDGTLPSGRYHLHAVNLSDGSRAAPPLDLMTASYQPPHGLPQQRLNEVSRKQRAALAFDSRNGVNTVFVCMGSFNEDENNKGWVLACDVTGPALELACAWPTTSNKDGAGIWMAGQGPVVAKNGLIRFMTGNGAFDGKTDFGNCFCAVRYTPKTPTLPASMEIEDWVAFYTDTGLVGANPTLADLSLIPNYGTARSMLPTNKRDFNDQDLGSGGTLHLDAEYTGFPDDLELGAGKDGRVFLVRSDNMGKPPLEWFSKENMHKVYACAAGPIQWFTYYQPGTPMPSDVTELDVIWQGKTRHQHGTPVAYRSPTHGIMIFTWGENSQLRAFKLVYNGDKTYALRYLGCSREVASAQSTGWGGGMPGGMLAVSANGSVPDTGVLWATIPYGDANKDITDGRLLAYAADRFTSDGFMEPIWDSERFGVRIVYSKFSGPVPINGKVLVPSYDATCKEIG